MCQHLLNCRFYTSFLLDVAASVQGRLRIINVEFIQEYSNRGSKEYFEISQKIIMEVRKFFRYSDESRHFEIKRSCHSGDRYLHYSISLCIFEYSIVFYIKLFIIYIIKNIYYMIYIYC
jgi:hypothetical protein